MVLDMRTYEIIKFIGGYVAALGGVDAIVFTAGVGENQQSIRSDVLEGLAYLGIRVDYEANKARGEEVEITTPDSAVRSFVIPTNEELGYRTGYPCDRGSDGIKCRGDGETSMQKVDVYHYLDSRNIWHEITEHEAVYSMGELSSVTLPYPEADAKNLFVGTIKSKSITSSRSKAINGWI